MLTERSPVIRRLLIMPVLLGLVLSSCAGLKDRDPFTTPALLLAEDASGMPTLEPNEIRGTWSQGLIQIENSTGTNYFFVLDELAIYQVLPRGETPIVRISEARDGKTYEFFLVKGSAEGTVKVPGRLIMDFQEEDL